jgi:hypothetical protein
VASGQAKGSSFTCPPLDMIINQTLNGFDVVHSHCLN